MVPVTPGVTVKVEVLTVATFMASLKVAVTTELEQTPVEALGGVTESTVGGGERGGVDGADGQRAGGGKGEDGVGGVVSDGSGNARSHRKGCGVDGGNVHGLAEGGGNDGVGTDHGGSVGRGDGEHGRRRVASVGGGRETPNEVSGQGVAEQVSDAGGEGGGVDGADGERAGGGKGEDGVGGVVSDGSGNAGSDGEGGSVDGANVHGLTEGGGHCGGHYSSVGARPEGAGRRGDENHGRRGQVWISEMIRIAASSHENDHQECCEPGLTSVLFAHQPCLSVLRRCLEDSGREFCVSVPYNSQQHHGNCSHRPLL